jgi:hypothetical protein
VAVPEHNFRLAHPSGTIASKLFEALPIPSLLSLRFEPAVMVSLGFVADGIGGGSAKHRGNFR